MAPACYRETKRRGGMKTSSLLAAMVLAATAGWLGAMAWNTQAQGRSPRFAQLTEADISEQQRPMVKYILSISRVGIGGPYNLFLRSPAGGQKELHPLGYLRLHPHVPAPLHQIAVLTPRRGGRSPGG